MKDVALTNLLVLSVGYGRFSCHRVSHALTSINIFLKVKIAVEHEDVWGPDVLFGKSNVGVVLDFLKDRQRRKRELAAQQAALSTSPPDLQAAADVVPTRSSTSTSTTTKTSTTSLPTTPLGPQQEPPTTSSSSIDVVRVPPDNTKPRGPTEAGEPPAPPRRRRRFLLHQVALTDIQATYAGADLVLGDILYSDFSEEVGAYVLDDVLVLLVSTILKSCAANGGKLLKKARSVTEELPRMDLNLEAVTSGAVTVTSGAVTTVRGHWEQAQETISKTGGEVLGKNGVVGAMSRTVSELFGGGFGGGSGSAVRGVQCSEGAVLPISVLQTSNVPGDDHNPRLLLQKKLSDVRTPLLGSFLSSEVPSQTLQQFFHSCLASAEDKLANSAWWFAATNAIETLAEGNRLLLDGNLLLDKWDSLAVAREREEAVLRSIRTNRFAGDAAPLAVRAEKLMARAELVKPRLMNQFIPGRWWTEGGPDTRKRRENSEGNNSAGGGA